MEEKKKLKEVSEQKEPGMKRKREGEALVEEEKSRTKVAIEETEEQIQDANVELQGVFKCKTLSRSKLLKVNTRHNLVIQ